MNWRSPAFLLLAALVCVAASVLLYAPALGGGFVFDDRYQFFARPDNPGPWSQYLLGPRPLVQLTYLINHAAAGPDADSFRVVNAAAHGLTSLAAGAVIFEFAALGAAAMAPAAGVAGAALFLAHPLQSEAVAYVSSRTDIFCALFFLLALHAFVRTRQAGRMSWTRACLISLFFGLAMASKEHAAGLLGLFLWLEWSYRRSWGGLRQGGAYRLYSILAAVGVLGGAFIGAYLYFARTIGSGGQASPWAYFFTQWRSWAEYAKLTVAPLSLNVDYDWPLSTVPPEAAAWMALLAVAAAVGLLIWRRDEGGLVAAGLMLAALTLAPTSSFIPLVDRIAERRMYLPLAGVLLAASGVVLRSKVPARTVQFAGLALAIGFAVLTYQRAGIWGNPARLWEDTVRGSPAKFRPQYWLARTYFESGRCDLAAPAFRAAYSKLRPGDDTFDLELAVALDCAGDYRGAADALDRLLTQNPSDAQAVALRGRLRIRQGQVEPGLEDLNRALALDPSQATALATRGEARLAMNQLEEGIADIERALALMGPDSRLVVMVDRAKARLTVQRLKQPAPSPALAPPR